MFALYHSGSARPVSSASWSRKSVPRPTGGYGDDAAGPAVAPEGATADTTVVTSAAAIARAMRRMAYLPDSWSAATSSAGSVRSNTWTWSIPPRQWSTWLPPNFARPITVLPCASLPTHALAEPAC